MDGPNREWLKRAAAVEDVSDPSIPQVDIIGGFPYARPKCGGCGEPLKIENAWMTDGCPCNSVLGTNSMNETRWRLLMELQQRQSNARDALAEELRTIEAAIDAAGGSIFKRNADFIADQSRKIKVVKAGVRELEALIQESHRLCGDAMNKNWIQLQLDRLLSKCIQIRS